MARKDKLSVSILQTSFGLVTNILIIAGKMEEMQKNEGDAKCN